MFTTRPELWGTFGMVSSTHHLATAAGMAVLEAGGTAVDAAVAAGFALQVAEPHLNGPGGDMSLLFAGPDGAPTVLCGQGPVPTSATIAHYLDLGLDRVPGAGLLAATVPGSTVAWLTLLRDHGRFGLDEVLSYAIHLAEGGIPVLPTISRGISSVAELFRSDWTGSAAVYLPGNRIPVAGEVLHNPALARTYRRLIAAGRSAGARRELQIDAALNAWTTGFVAEEIGRFVAVPRLDSSGVPHAGVLSGADLAGWRPGYEPPAAAVFGDWTVFKTGPWGQGPVLLQQLRILDELGVSAAADGEDADFVHLVIEVAKLAFADRDAWYGDSEPVPLTALLSDEYTRERARLVGAVADLTMRPGRPGGAAPRLPQFDQPDPGAAPAGGANRQAAGLGEPTVSRSGEVRGDTCQVDVVDRWGNTVAATPSGGWLQSSPVIPELGFPLGTRAQMTTLEAGLPASLRPGRRPRTTLSPSMAVRNGRVELAFGTPGGDQQDQWQLLFFLRAVAGGRHLQQVIDAPSFHSTHFPSSFYPRESVPGQLVIEDRWPDQVLAELERRGHRLVRSDPWTLGRMCVVGRDRDGPVLRAAADARGAQAYAAGR